MKVCEFDREPHQGRCRPWDGVRGHTPRTPGCTCSTMPDGTPSYDDAECPVHALAGDR